MIYSKTKQVLIFW